MEKIKAFIPDTVTFSRIVFSLGLLTLSPASELFAALYVLCGITDILDGFLARRLHTESKTGEALDSLADLVFAAAYTVKILPLLRLPMWIPGWTARIAAVKILGIVKSSLRERQPRVVHSSLNKLTGLLIFLLPLAARLINVCCMAAAACGAATFSAAEDLFSRKADRQQDIDRRNHYGYRIDR